MAANVDDQADSEKFFNDACELSACHSFLDNFFKYNPHTMVNFATDTLESVLRNNVATDDNKASYVLLYLHRSNDPFSLEFCAALAREKLEDILGDSAVFTVIAWDMSTRKVQFALKEAIISSLKGKVYADYVTENKPVALVIDRDRKIADLWDNSNELENLINILEGYQKIAHIRNGDDPVNVLKEINPTNFQQQMFDLLGNRDYDSFEHDEHELLRCKIGYHLYGPPDEYLQNTENENIDIRKGTYKLKGREEAITLILNLIVTENDKYCKWNGRVVISFIKVCAEALAQDKQKRRAEAKDYNPDADFLQMPLFILRKCKGQLNQGPFCRLIIDDRCRVYQSWNAYLQNNVLHPCLMVCPYQGKYQTMDDGDSDVWLEEHFSPSTSTTKKVLSIADTGLGIAGIAAGGVCMFVAAPVVIMGATATGVASGIYAATRSINTLTDRQKHGQKISVSDPESRSAFITIAGSALTLGMMGSMRAVSYLAGKGVSLGQNVKIFLYGLNAAALGISGVGIGNTIYQLLLRDEKPTALQLLQLGASIFFFGNSLYNFRAVGSVIDESQARALSEIEATLSSNRQRKTFNKMLKETQRLEGNTAGKAEVISAMRNMENPEQVIRVLNRHNKMLNKAEVRFSVKNGDVLFNGQKVDIMDVSKFSNLYRGSFLRNLPPIPENLTPTVKYSINLELNEFLKKNITILNIAANLCTSSDDIEEFAAKVLCSFAPIIREFFYRLSSLFIESLNELQNDGILKDITRLFPDNDPIILIMKWICNTLQRIPAFETISVEKRWNETDIETVLKELMCRFRTWLTHLLYEEHSPEDRKANRRVGKQEKKKRECNVCAGYFYL